MAGREGQTLNAAAADWLAKQQRSEFSAAERAELEQWLDADPAHAVAFAQAEYAWERAERLRAVPAQAFERPMPRTPRSSFHWGRIAAAAALAIVMLGSGYWYTTWKANVFTTGVGERRTIALADGSLINLNTSSHLEVDLTREFRTVRLSQGEALFKVAKDPARPFIVEVGSTEVRAVGTAFNIRMRSQVVEVTVTEGIVTVDNDRVAAGSAAVVGQGAVHQISLDQDVVRRRVAWRDGVVEFKGETLEQAVEEFNRYGNTPIVVADPAIASIRVGGRFETDEAGKFLDSVQRTFAVRVEKGEGGATYLFARE